MNRSPTTPVPRGDLGAVDEGPVAPVAATAARADPVIDLSALTKLYEPTPRWMRPFARTHIRHPVLALSDVDLRVGEGELCAVVGPNGAGKTTLFRIIVGLTSATGGRGRVLGMDVEDRSEAVRQVVGWMPSEDRSLLMRATCRENLLLHGRLQGMQRAELGRRIPHVIEEVGLTSQMNAVVATLSAGMKARLRLARALLPSPRALILDEPTGAVDPIAAHSLLTLITDLVREHRLSVLISSHRLEEIEALQSRALLLDQGRVRYSGDLDVLRGKYESPKVELEFADAASAAAAAQTLRLTGIKVSETRGTVVTCALGVHDGVGPVLRGLASLTEKLVHVRETPMPLRDLIARLYRREGDDTR